MRADVPAPPPANRDSEPAVPPVHHVRDRSDTEARHLHGQGRNRLLQKCDCGGQVGKRDTRLLR